MMWVYEHLYCCVEPTHQHINTLMKTTIGALITEKVGKHLCVLYYII